MSTSKIPCPLKRSETIEIYFMEHRAKLIDIAAFLDRIDRTADDLRGAEDFRIAALRAGIGILTDGKSNRARRVLELFSDPSKEPIAKAGMKGALGAYQSQTKQKPLKESTTEHIEHTEKGKWQ